MIDNSPTKLAFSAAGLTSAEASVRRQKYGANELAVEKPESAWVKLARQFADLLVIILIIAGALAFFLGERTDAIVILSIVLINAIIGFVQEFRTEKMLDALKKLVAPSAQVWRAGKKITIPAREIVVDDVIFLKPGTRVPADAKLIAADDLNVDEAILTGESAPVIKNSHSKKPEECTVFAGTIIEAGSGRAVVTKIGGKTEFGKVATLTTQVTKGASPLTKEMKTIGVFVGKVSLVISVILFAVGYFWQDYSLIESLLFAVAVAIAAVPEGLPVTITTALALGMRRLAGKRALVRDLKSVETLGATTIICSDKTGTLTRNQMTVTRIWLSKSGEFEATGGGYDPTKGRVKLVERGRDSEMLFAIADACNEAELVKSKSGWHIVGDPTEAALKVVARKFGSLPKWSRLKTFPFHADRKRMSVVVAPSRSHEEVKIFAKGAPEHLLECCTHFLDGQRVRPLDAKTRKRILDHTGIFAGNALRVLAGAYREIKTSEVKQLSAETAERKLIFVGLFGMYDAPRSDTKEAVRLCEQAGIRITMITGDNGLTARAIGKVVGLADDTTPIVTGSELDQLSATALLKLLRKKQNIIFARVKPADKLRIVEAYKKLGEVVAVTGDGVNDAPALKSADIGVAMGRTGADVAKEAASLVLTDDSFSSVVAAVAEGRRIYANMRKFVIYIFSCNIGELVVIFTAIILRLPIPLTAALILLVDLGTDLLPSLALGVDPADPEAMRQPPRDPRKRILEKDFVKHFVVVGLLIGALVIGGYLGVLFLGGWEWGSQLAFDSPLHRHAASFAFATLVIIQLFNAFNFRSDKLSAFSARVQTNLWLWVSILISVLLVWTVVELPAAQTLFKTSGLSLAEWGAVVVLSAGILVFEESRKFFARTFVKQKC